MWKLQDIYLLLQSCVPHVQLTGKQSFLSLKMGVAVFPYIGESDLAAGKLVWETNSTANMRRGHFEFVHNKIKNSFEDDALLIKQKYTPLNKSSLSKASVKAI